jgi:hypothetical protein
MLQRRKREARVDAQLLRGVDRPVRIVKQFSTDRDHICLAISQDRFGLVRVHNQADCNRRNSRFGADPFSEVDLVAILAGMF